MRPSSLIIAAATASLAIGALAAPVSAQNAPRLAFVNGVSGRTVDVCVGNTEVKSRLRYGAWFQRTFTTGPKVVRFRRAAAGSCTGSILGTENVNLTLDSDLTLVAAKRADKVVAWDNQTSPAAINPNGWLAFRNGADLGEAVFTRNDGFFVSALPPTLGKGEEDRTAGFGNLTFLAAATSLDAAEPLAQGHYQVVEGRRLEVILVGDRAGNARFVAIYRTRIPF